MNTKLGGFAAKLGLGRNEQPKKEVAQAPEKQPTQIKLEKGEPWEVPEGVEDIMLFLGPAKQGIVALVSAHYNATESAWDLSVPNYYKKYDKRDYPKRTVNAGDEITLGRNEWPPYPKTFAKLGYSREHLKLENKDGKLLLTDISTFGTSVEY